jgi:hypothetical protein
LPLRLLCVDDDRLERTNKLSVVLLSHGVILIYGNVAVLSCYRQRYVLYVIL